ncbi:MAG: DUF1697 domain-containing protein [Trueperaceae bacterium]|nr:DUF1697 domain-containing protein [Trueperaceae bacterium]
MTTFVALLRAVNVGGTGMLPMSDLVAMAESAGFERVRTYIASGNLLFESPRSASEVKESLERALAAYAGKPVGVILDGPPPADFLDHVVAPDGEEVRGGVREIYVHYGAGMGTSKLKLPAAKAGTARNMNTVARLVAMTHEYRSD